MQRLSWVGSFLVGTLGLAACDSSEPSAPPVAPAPVEPAVTPEASLNAYADALVLKYPSDLSGHAPALKTLDAPLSYILVFTTANPAMLTKDISENDKAGYESNLKITNRWQAMYCTPELQALLRERGVFSGGAHLNDASGESHSLAICTAADGESSSAADEGGNCTGRQREVMRALLKSEGLTCDSVRYCGAMTAQNIRVTCNDNAFAYRIRDKGAGYYAEFD